MAVDGPQGPIILELMLDADATIAVALAEARTRCAAGLQGSAIDWEAGVVGVWGIRCGRDVIPGDGDRIELYRALPDDPRQRRRQRARGRGR